MKKAAFAALLVLVIFSPAISHAAAPGVAGPLVPGQTAVGSESNGSDYTLCTLRDLANNIINFAVYLSVFVATIMFAYGGVLYLTAAGSGPEQIKKAHKVLVNVLIGILIVLLAWLLVNIVLSVLSNGNISFWTNWFGGDACKNPVSANFAPLPAGQAGIQSAGGGGPVPLKSGTLSNDAALNALHAGSVCGEGTGLMCLDDGANCQGVQAQTIDNLVSLHNASGADFTITSCTNGDHKGGVYSHSNGYKADVRVNSALDSYIKHNFTYTGYNPNFGGPGFPAYTYVDNCHNVYAYETNPVHWDISAAKPCGY